MKKIALTSAVIIIVILAIAIAGCSALKTPGSSQASAAGSGSAAASGGGAASGSGGSCPAVTAATSWSGKWVSWSYSDPCFDARIHFYPATADNPDPWDSTMAGVEDFPVTFTQTGCDVTGSITVGPNGTLVAPPGCPITLTGKVDSTGAVAGSWHAYCNIEANGAPSSDEIGRAHV